ncbi:MAG: Gx transporter family protein [Solobacterium sp.]|nr:Gx transporter family protein [Solobacterium sp.]
MTIERTRRFTTLAMLTAIAIALNILESVWIGPIFGMLRIGLANIASLMALKLLGRREMAIVSAMRVLFGSLIRGTIFSSTFWISAGGVTLSSLVMLICDYFESTLLFTSIIGAITHSFGQVLVVMALYAQPGIAAVLPYLLGGSIPTGILTGIVAKGVLTRIKPLPRQ